VRVARHGFRKLALHARSDHATDFVNTTSVALLRPLLSASAVAPNDVGVYLFHAPALSGIIERMLPRRWNELPGVHHIKAYVFDDDIVSACTALSPADGALAQLLSGANLSENYFINRRDRVIHLTNVSHTSASICRDIVVNVPERRATRFVIITIDFSNLSYVHMHIDYSWRHWHCRYASLWWGCD
jgi:hypothetical protein